MSSRRALLIRGCLHYIFFGSIRCLTGCVQRGWFSSVLLCQLTMSGTSTPRSLKAGLMWEAAYISSAGFFSRLASWKLEATRDLFSFWQFSGVQKLKPVLARNPQKAFYENKLRVFWEALKPYAFKSSHYQLSKWSDRLFHPVLVPLSDKKMEVFTLHDVSLGAKK